MIKPLNSRHMGIIRASETRGRGEVWSQAESITAADIWQREFADHYGDETGPRGHRSRVIEAIAHEIGRSYEAVHNRFNGRGPTFGSMQQSTPRQAPAELLAERERRREAANHMTQTAVFFGDPPPGYSALDKREGGR